MESIKEHLFCRRCGSTDEHNVWFFCGHLKTIFCEPCTKKWGAHMEGDRKVGCNVQEDHIDYMVDTVKVVIQ